MSLRQLLNKLEEAKEQGSYAPSVIFASYTVRSLQRPWTSSTFVFTSWPSKQITMKFATMILVLALAAVSNAYVGPCFNQYVIKLLISQSLQYSISPRADPDQGIGNYCFCEGDGKPLTL